MNYNGYVKDGVICLDEAVRLPEGTKVTVRAEKPARSARRGGVRKTIARKRSLEFKSLLKFAGVITDLPSDASRNIDHYLYGAPKRKK